MHAHCKGNKVHSLGFQYDATRDPNRRRDTVKLAEALKPKIRNGDMHVAGHDH